MSKLQKPTEQSEWKDHELTPFEANLLGNLRIVQNSVAEMVRNIQGNVLGNAAGDRWGYKPEDTLQYNVDFEEGSTTVKVKVMPNEKKAK